MAEDCSQWTCSVCGSVGMQESDGFYYCLFCNSQAEDVIETGVADEDFIDKGGFGGGALYSQSFRRSRPKSATLVQPLSQFDPQSQQFWTQLTQEEERVKAEKVEDMMSPTEPSDFPSAVKTRKRVVSYYEEVRKRYVMGLQMMIEAQCEALVNRFKVNPLICGIVGPIWLRHVAKSRVFSDGWAKEAVQGSDMQIAGSWVKDCWDDEAVHDSQTQTAGSWVKDCWDDEAIHDSQTQTAEKPPEFKPRKKYRQEPHDHDKKRAIMIWLKSLKRVLPLPCSLAISYLVCHIARESILATDIVKWSIEGKLTYFDAFAEIEKRMVNRLPDFPLSLKDMFRPSLSVSAQQLESLAATISESVGLNLPPKNFYAIASRYLRELSLPLEKILPHACCIHEWMMPPELWLSINGSRIPSQVFIMSILIIAIRILYNINGFGVWEKSLSNRVEKTGFAHCHKMREENNGSSPENDDGWVTNQGKRSQQNHKFDFDTEELLHELEARYHDIDHSYEYSKDLHSFLKYCQDVVFAGLEPPLEFYREEKSLVDQFWQFYQKEKDSEKLAEDDNVGVRVPEDKATSVGSDLLEESIDASSSRYSDEHENTCDSGSGCAETFKEEAIRQLKINMEENNFLYIPPRVNVKRLDYLQYVRKKDEGSLAYAAHADYYILLRSCARVAQIDIRLMHVAVMSLERRLAWIEHRIEHCLLHLSLRTVTCENCGDDFPSQAPDTDPIGLSQLSL